jgi:hypothetical protein
VVHGRDERTNERVGVAHNREVIRVDEVCDRTGNCGCELHLPRRRYKLIASVHEYRRGHVDLADPGLSRVPTQGGSGLPDSLRIPSQQLSPGPIGEAGVRQLRACEVSDDVPRKCFGQEPSCQCDRRQGSEHQMFGGRGAEPVAGRAHDQPGHSIGMTAPNELRDGTAHRVPHGDESLDTQSVGERDDVVGRVFERERRRGSNSSPMAPMIGRDDVKLVLEHRERREPVEGCSGAEAVQQHQGWRIGRPLALVREGRPPARQHNLSHAGQGRHGTSTHDITHDIA